MGYTPAGLQNLVRLKSNLRRNEAALNYLFKLGLTPTTISKYHLGIKEPYRSRVDGELIANVLCYPLLTREGDPVKRYGYVNIPGVTKNAPRQDNWSTGMPAVYFSAPIIGRQILFVVDSCQELWLLDQHLADSPLRDELVVAISSHYGGIPVEWKTTEFWAPWAKVYFGHHTDDIGQKRARDIARLCGREIFRIVVPEDMGRDWVAYFLSGGTAEQLSNLLKTAPAVSSPQPSEEVSSDRLGEFAVAPVNINGAFVRGCLYYPFNVEKRELETVGRKGHELISRVVTSYVTKVLRSDGVILDIVRLAAPKGTSLERRVLALTDGTRIEKEPQPGHHTTWQLDSLHDFIKAVQSGKAAPHRPIREILPDIITHLRSSVWLPHEEEYTLLALYAALSFVYQVFEAIPLIFVCGEKGTGKSELGDAVASVSCNATVIGQGSAAGVIRLLNEARGLIVLDDLESIGKSLRATSFGDISQMLKLSYKKMTGRKALTDRNGRTSVFDFYGPKVINNTTGADDILSSRMFHIYTRRMPEGAHQNVMLLGSDPEDVIRLRNELHIWGMANARHIHEHYMRVVKARGDRLAEITAPLRTIAELSGDRAILTSFEAALRLQESRRKKVDDPVSLLREAVDNCIRRGAIHEVSAAELRLELALLGQQFQPEDLDSNGLDWRRPEWVGNQLRAMGVRDTSEKVPRVRLYGMITRVYKLRQDYVRKVLAALPQPHEGLLTQRGLLDFCEQTRCSSCIYGAVCGQTVTGLLNSKRCSRGHSGRRSLRGE